MTETFGFSGGQVDRTGAYPVVKNVLLCGPSSANRRRYRPEAFAGGRVDRYANVPVFLDHAAARDSRKFAEKIGTIENPRLRGDGMPIGDIAVNSGHPLAEAFLFDAQHKPAACGMSHVAQCDTRSGKDGVEEIIELIAAESVDIVLQPATTRGLYESRMATMIRESVGGGRVDSRAGFLEAIAKPVQTIGIQRAAKPAKAPPRRRSESRGAGRPVVTDRQSFLDAISE